MRARRKRRADGHDFVPRETRSFEVEHVQGLWHLDFHEGSRPVLNAAGEWKDAHTLGIWLDQNVVGVVEAKKVTTASNLAHPGRALRPRHHQQPHYFDGLRCPFLDSANGEVFWFHDVRHPRNRVELLDRDLEAVADSC